MHIRAHTPRRSPLALVTLALLAACAAAPEHPPAPARIAAPRPTARRPEPALADAPAPLATGRLVEESEVGDLSGFKRPTDALPTPALAALHATPSPSPEVVAAVRPVAVATPEASSEPESLLTHTGPKTPPNVAAAMRLIEEGRQQLAQGRYDQASDRFERGVAIDPTNAYGYYYLAQLNYLMKKYDQAIAFSGRAVSLARNDRHWLARAYSLRGAVFEEVGRYPDARKAYQKAVEADPNNSAARIGAARLNGSQ